jgi:hypothetical protein
MKERPVGGTDRASVSYHENVMPAPSANCCLDDLIRIAHRFAALDLVDVFHAGDDLAPGGVLLVEKTGVVEADEKLRIG